MPKKKSVKNKKRKNNLGNGDSYLAPPRAGFSLFSAYQKAPTKNVVANFILPLILQALMFDVYFLII